MSRLRPPDLTRRVKPLPNHVVLLAIGEQYQTPSIFRRYMIWIVGKPECSMKSLSSCSVRSTITHMYHTRTFAQTRVWRGRSLRVWTRARISNSPVELPGFGSTSHVTPAECATLGYVGHPRDAQCTHGESVWRSTAMVVTTRLHHHCEAQPGRRKPGVWLGLGIVGTQGQRPTTMAFREQNQASTTPPFEFAGLSQSALFVKKIYTHQKFTQRMLSAYAILY